MCPSSLHSPVGTCRRIRRATCPCRLPPYQVRVTCPQVRRARESQQSQQLHRDVFYSPELARVTLGGVAPEPSGKEEGRPGQAWEDR